MNDQFGVAIDDINSECRNKNKEYPQMKKWHRIINNKQYSRFW